MVQIKYGLMYTEIYKIQLFYKSQTNYKFSKMVAGITISAFGALNSIQFFFF